ncbi:MAG: hypothetical protein HGA39_07710 [Coriobacteriia bacterium]|nr:hypothetical protein [Coriobacteriia bacterium]
MRRIAFALLLVLAIVGVAGCGTKATSSGASGSATQQTGPGSDAWKKQVSAYFAQWDTVDDKEIAAQQVFIDFTKLLNNGTGPSEAQIATLVKTSNEYPQLVKDAEAIVPPEELKAYHALWLKTLAAGSDAFKAMGEGMIDLDLAKIKTAEKLAVTADTAKEAQDVELARFNKTYGTNY